MAARFRTLPAPASAPDQLLQVRDTLSLAYKGAKLPVEGSRSCLQDEGERHTLLLSPASAPGYLSPLHDHDDSTASPDDLSFGSNSDQSMKDQQLKEQPTVSGACTLGRRSLEESPSDGMCRGDGTNSHGDSLAASVCEALVTARNQASLEVDAIHMQGHFSLEAPDHFPATDDVTSAVAPEKIFMRLGDGSSTTLSDPSRQGQRPACPDVPWLVPQLSRMGRLEPSRHLSPSLRGPEDSTEHVALSMFEVIVCPEEPSEGLQFEFGKVYSSPWPPIRRLCLCDDCTVEVHTPHDAGCEEICPPLQTSSAENHSLLKTPRGNVVIVVKRDRMDATGARVVRSRTAEPSAAEGPPRKLATLKTWFSRVWNSKAARLEGSTQR